VLSFGTALTVGVEERCIRREARSTLEVGDVAGVKVAAGAGMVAGGVAASLRNGEGERRGGGAYLTCLTEAHNIGARLASMAWQQGLQAAPQR